MTVKKKFKQNLQSICIAFIVDSFVANNLKTAILVSTLRDKKKEYILTLIKNTGIIKKIVDKSLHALLDNKSFTEM